MRATTADLAAALDATRRAALAAGVTEADRWRVEKGSKTYGRAYRLWLQHVDPTHTGHYQPVVRDFLGMTAGEAVRTLGVLRDAFHAVTWDRDRARET